MVSGFEYDANGTVFLMIQLSHLALFLIIILIKYVILSVIQWNVLGLEFYLASFK